MPVIKIQTSAVSSFANDIRSMRSRSEELNSKLKVAENNLDWKVQARSNISERITKLQRRINVQEEKFEALARALERAADEFETKDKNLSREAKEIVYLMNNVLKRQEMLPAKFVNPMMSLIGKLDAFEITNLLFGAQTPTPVTLGLIQAAAGFITERYNRPDDERSNFARFINNDIKADGSILHGEKSGSTEFIGFDASGNTEGDLLYWKAGIRNDASFKLKDEDGDWNVNKFGISSKASASGALARGEAKGNVGYLHGKINGEAGAVTAGAGVKAMLWDDGDFNPSLSIGAEASASALKGRAEAGIGTDVIGVGVKAEGDVLHAEAKAKAGIGYIENKDGEAVYGVSAEARAMASAAQGKVKGGVTVLGIDVDVGLKGYAGAAGVEAGGSMSFDGVTASVSGALAIGAGVDISVDWSDAKWIGDTYDAVKYVTDKAADTAGKFLISGFRTVQGWF